MKEYYKIRFGKDQEQYGIGTPTDPLVLFYERYRRLEKASKPIYNENVRSEKRQFGLFSSVWRLATVRLKHDYEKHLQAHGFTHTPNGDLVRMVTPAEPTAATMPEMTEQAMHDLLERVKQNDHVATRELKQLAKSDPGKWLANLDLLSIARNEITHCIAANDPVSKTLLEELLQMKLDMLSSAASSPMEAMLVEHIQVGVIAAQYNRLMLIDGRRSMRECDSLEKRAENAETQIRDNLKMFHELKMLVNSNWTKLPSELPIQEPVDRKQQSARQSRSVDDLAGQLDDNLCSMVI